MKNKRSLIFTLILTFVIALTCLSGCNLYSNYDAKTIVSIEKTQTDGLKDIYTIIYSDGSEYSFEITNGKNGVDGKDGENGVDGKDGENGQEISIDDIYAKYLETNPDKTYEEFLREVLEVNSTSNTVSINKSLQSSAKIYTEFTVTESYKLNPMYTTKETAVYLGSAVVYKVDSDYTYFITNYHVIYNSSALEQNKKAKKIVCYLYGSEGEPRKTNNKDENSCTIYDYGQYGISCEYVGGSITADIAIVKAKTSDVKAINENVKTITFADSYCVGDTAIAIGNPEGEGISVTKGIVSVDNEYISLAIDGTTRTYRSIRIDTSIYSGSSGGGLFNEDGKLIGITNAGDVEDQNVNYAIPLEIVKSTVENIMHYGGSAKKIALGIEVLSSNSKYVFDQEKGEGKIVETITVSNVTSGSISEKLGLQVGDVLVALVVDDIEYTINRSFNIGDALFTVRSGDKISFKIIRSGQEKSSLIYTVLESDLTVVA